MGVGSMIPMAGSKIPPYDVDANKTFLGCQTANPDGVSEAWAGLENPSGSGVYCRLIEVEVCVENGTFGSDSNDDLGAVWLSIDTVPGSGLTSITRTRARDALTETTSALLSSCNMMKGLVTAGFTLNNVIKKHLPQYTKPTAWPLTISHSVLWKFTAGPYFGPGKTVEILPCRFCLTNAATVSFLWQEIPGATG